MNNAAGSCQQLPHHHCNERRATAQCTLSACNMLQLAGMLAAMHDKRTRHPALSSATQSCRGHLLRLNKPLPALCSKLAQLQQHTGLQTSRIGI